MTAACRCRGAGAPGNVPADVMWWDVRDFLWEAWVNACACACVHMEESVFLTVTWNRCWMCRKRVYHPSRAFTPRWTQLFPWHVFVSGDVTTVSKEDERKRKMCSRGFCFCRCNFETRFQRRHLEGNSSICCPWWQWSNWRGTQQLVVRDSTLMTVKHKDFV